MRPAIRLRLAERRRGSGILMRLPAIRCLTLVLHFVIAVHVGSDAAGTRVWQEITHQQALTQLLQALLPKITHTEKVILVHRKHLTYLGDITALETVIRTYRKIKLFDRCIIYLLRYW